MFVFDLVDEVVLEGLDDEVFVVHEEDIFGNGNGLVAVVNGGGGVEKFEALAVAFVFGGGILDEGILQEAVERSGADDFLGVVANAGDGFKDVLNGVALHRGDANKGGVVEEEEFLPDVFFGGLEARRFLALGVEEVELVGDDEAGLFFLLNEAGDLAILSGDASGEIDDEETDVSAADRALAAHGGKDLYGVLHAGAFTEAGGVDDVVLFIAPDVGDVDSITSGSRDFGDHRALILENGIDEGGFTGIGFADDGDLKAVLEVVVIDICLFLGLKFGEFAIDTVEEVIDSAPVFGGGGESVAEAEAGEVAGGVIVVRAVGLVHGEDDVGIGLTEELGHFLVDGVNASAGINDEDDEVGGVHSDEGLEGDLIGETVFIEGADASGIDEFAGILGESAGSCDAVASDAGLVKNDGDASSGQAIEEGGLSDVGSSDDGDLEWTGGHFVLRFKI